MDQIEFENYIEKMKHRVEEGDFVTAAKVADKVDWDNVKDINLLMYVAKIYENINDFMSAKAILEYAYTVAPVKNRLYFAMCSINIKMKELKEARDYYVDFCMSFPDDPRKNLLKYYFLKAKGADIDQQIRLLKDYTDEEKEEDMLYELALLYDKINNEEKVIETCNFIIDFFGVKINGFGKDALLLKKKWTTLTENEEKLLFDARFNQQQMVENDTNYGLGSEDKLAIIKKEDNEEKETADKEQIEQQNYKMLDEDIENNKEPIEKIVREEKVPIENSEEEIVNINNKNLPTPQILYSPSKDSYEATETEQMYINNTNEKKEKLKQLIQKLKQENEETNITEEGQTINFEENIINNTTEDEKEENKKDEDNTNNHSLIQEIIKDTSINNTNEEDIVRTESIDDIKKEIEKLYEEEQGFNKFRKQIFVLHGRYKNMNNNFKLHMIIESYSKEEGIDIAKSELNYIHKHQGENKKVAKVSAYNMNDNGFDYYLQKLGNRDLIIESAGKLKDQVLDDIEEFVLNKRNKNIIALVDIINNFDKLAERRSSFIDRFDIYSVLSDKTKKEDKNLENTQKEDKNLQQTIKNEDQIETKNHIVENKNKYEDEEDLYQKINIQLKRDEDIPIEKNEELIQKALRMKREKQKLLNRQENSIDQDIIDEDIENKQDQDILDIEEPKPKKQKVNLLENELTDDEFVEFCKSYAKSIDCVLQGKTISVIYDCIEDMKDSNIPLTEENAISLIEDAADRAEKPRLFYKPKYDKEGCLILSEEHFV